jgi:hypothetical protein
MSFLIVNNFENNPETIEFIHFSNKYYCVNIQWYMSIQKKRAGKSNLETSTGKRNYQEKQVNILRK